MAGQLVCFSMGFKAQHIHLLWCLYQIKSRHAYMFVFWSAGRGGPSFSFTIWLRYTCVTTDTRVPFYQHGLTLITIWISNHMPSKRWDEFTYPFPNFNGCTVEVWEWIGTFIPYFVMDVIILSHDDVIKWKHFPCYWPFVQGIHRSPVNSPHKGQ